MENEKIRVAPDHWTFTDNDHTVLTVEIALPGVDKKNISLKMHEDSFFLLAPNGDRVYSLSHGTCHPVDVARAKATYENGLLRLEVPFKETRKNATAVKVV